MWLWSRIIQETPPGCGGAENVVGEEESSGSSTRMWRSRGCGWGVGEFRKLHQDVEEQRMWLWSRIIQETPPGCGGAEAVVGEEESSGSSTRMWRSRGCGCGVG